MGDGFMGYKHAQRLFDRKLIEEAISRHQSLSTAAKHLKISKGTLSVKMKAMNIKTPKSVAYEEA